MSEDIQYLKGHRILDGVDLDADILAAEPFIRRRGPADPVNDGSLGTPAYVPGSQNKDGSSF